MVEVPEVVDVLVVPDDLAAVHVERDRRRHVEVVLVVAGQLVLGRRRSDRGAEVDEVQLGIIAGRVPGPDRHPLLARRVSPGLGAGLPWEGDRVGAPELLARKGVVGDHDAGVGAALDRAGAAGDHLAIGHDRPGARPARLGLEVGDGGFPDLRARPRVDRIDAAVSARGVEQIAPDRQVALGPAPTFELGRVLALVAPDRRAAGGVHCLDPVPGLRDVHHPVVHKRRALEAPGRQGPRPHQAEAADIARIDLVQRAEAPVVQGPPEHQPVGRIGTAQHRVGDRNIGPGGSREGRRIGHRVLRGRLGGGRPRERKQSHDPHRREGGRTQAGHLPVSPLPAASHPADLACRPGRRSLSTIGGERAAA